MNFALIMSREQPTTLKDKFEYVFDEVRRDWRYKNNN